MDKEQIDKNGLYVLKEPVRIHINTKNTGYPSIRVTPFSLDRKLATLYESEFAEMFRPATQEEAGFEPQQKDHTELKKECVKLAIEYDPEDGELVNLAKEIYTFITNE